MNIENIILSEGSHILYNIKKPRIGKSMETENRAVIVRGWRRRELEGPGFLPEVMECSGISGVRCATL